MAMKKSIGLPEAGQRNVMFEGEFGDGSHALTEILTTLEVGKCIGQPGLTRTPFSVEEYDVIFPVDCVAERSVLVGCHIACELARQGDDLGLLAEKVADCLLGV